jgi:hypothetical protein
VHSLGNAKTPPAATKDQRFELVASIEPIVTIALRAAGHMGSDFCLSALDQVFPVVEKTLCSETVHSPGCSGAGWNAT